MKIKNRSSVAMSTVLTPTLCKAARVLAHWSQEDLASKAGVSVRSVVRFELADVDDPETPGNVDAAPSPSPKIRDKLYAAFISGGIQFIAANGETSELDGVGLRAKPKHPHNGIKLV